MPPATLVLAQHFLRSRRLLQKQVASAFRPVPTVLLSAPGERRSNDDED